MVMRGPPSPATFGRNRAVGELEVLDVANRVDAVGRRAAKVDDREAAVLIIDDVVERPFAGEHEDVVAVSAVDRVVVRAAAKVSSKSEPMTFCA